MGRLECITALDAFLLRLFPGVRRVPPMDQLDMPFPGALCAAADLVMMPGGEFLPAMDALPFCLFPGAWRVFLPFPGALCAARQPPPA